MCDWLERAYEAHNVHLVFLPVDAKWDPYQQEADSGRCSNAATSRGSALRYRPRPAGRRLPALLVQEVFVYPPHHWGNRTATGWTT